MPQLFQKPYSSLDKAHKQMTKLMLAQYAGEQVTAETGNSAEQVANVIELLDDVIESSRALIIDTDSVVASVKDNPNGRRFRAEVLPPKNLELINRASRRSQPIIATFDASKVSAVSVTAIQARMDEWRKLIDQLPVLAADVYTRPNNAPREDLANIKKQIEGIFTVSDAMYNNLNTKLIATSKFVGAGWMQSNSF
jgi:hypothetical protein